MYSQINDYADQRLDVYARMSEPQLRRIYEPKEGLFIAESPMVIERALDAGFMPESVLTCMEAYLGHGKEIIKRIEAEHPQMPVYVGTDDVLGQIRGYQLTRGVLCAMRRHELPEAEDILEGKNHIVILDDVENPSNVGAIFRSAAAMFMDGIMLTTDCSDPLYRRAARVSAGTVFQIPWTYIKTDYIGFLRDHGYKVAAMALSDDSVPISDARLKKEEKLAIVMGNEGYGLPGEVTDRCDYVVKIPMAQGIDSLNVAAASAVAFFAISN
jgi:tRNA G18 (ribose-2'-O)-methylase SpoU